MKCPRCGTHNFDDATNCTNCGIQIIQGRVEQPTVAQTRNNPSQKPTVSQRQPTLAPNPTTNQPRKSNTPRPPRPPRPPNQQKPQTQTKSQVQSQTPKPTLQQPSVQQQPKPQQSSPQPQRPQQTQMQPQQQQSQRTQQAPTQPPPQQPSQDEIPVVQGMVPPPPDPQFQVTPSSAPPQQPQGPAQVPQPTPPPIQLPPPQMPMPMPMPMPPQPIPPNEQMLPMPMPMPMQMEQLQPALTQQTIVKPTSGICSICDRDTLVFLDNGMGQCLYCGRSFDWLNPQLKRLSEEEEPNPFIATEDEILSLEERKAEVGPEETAFHDSETKIAFGKDKKKKQDTDEEMLTDEKRLAMLEDRFLNGQVSEDTYKQLKGKFLKKILKNLEDKLIKGEITENEFNELKDEFNQ